MNPWDRQPAETDKAWIAFVAYRDLGAGKRTIPAAIKASGKHPGQIRAWERWGSANEWGARVTAWDNHLDANVKQPALIDEARKRAIRQAELGQSMQDVARKALKGLGKRASTLKGTEVASLAKGGAELERLAMGEPTEIQAHQFAKDTRDRLRSLFPDEAGAT